MLAGPTGSSKTSVFRAYAAARGLPFALVECNAAMDPGTVLGRTTIAPDGSVRWVDGDFTLVVRYGGVGLIDEINMAHPRITASFHQLLAVTRRMGIAEAGETVIAGRGGTGEPQPTLFGACLNVRYQGTVRLSEALDNRFAMHFDWDYERSVEEQLVTSGRLLDMAATIRGLDENPYPALDQRLDGVRAPRSAAGHGLGPAFPGQPLRSRGAGAGCPGARSQCGSDLRGFREGG